MIATRTAAALRTGDVIETDTGRFVAVDAIEEEGDALLVTVLTHTEYDPTTGLYSNDDDLIRLPVDEEVRVFTG